MPDSEHPPPPTNGYHALVENFPNGVLVLFDADLRYRLVGPSSLPFSGRAASDMAGKPVDELFTSEAVEVLEPALRATIDGDHQSFDIDYDGEVHHVETRPVQVDGDPYGVLVTQAVTEERRTARELAEKTERLDEFASMVSHDLRNTLTIAHGYLAQYRETGDDSDLDAVEEAVERIEELTTGLTAIARHGTATGDVEPVALEGVARDAWRIIDTRSATLSTEPCTVTGDSGQFRTLFENLFRNAIGHGGDDVAVRVGPLDDGFYVEDTGRGIPEEDRDRVFEHGYTTGYGGTGVGLTIVQRIASSYGFDVSLAESADGGARFEFRAIDT